MKVFRDNPPEKVIPGQNTFRPMKGWDEREKKPKKKPYVPFGENKPEESETPSSESESEIHYNTGALRGMLHPSL